MDARNATTTCSGNVPPVPETSEESVATLFEQAPDPIVIGDPKGYVLDANTAACRLHLPGVTTCRRVEEELQTSKERMQRVLESLDEGFFLLDHDWRLADVNPAGSEIVGRRREDLVGQVLWEVLPELKESVFEETFRRAATEARSVRVEAYYPPLGQWVKVHAYPYADGLAVLVRDVTGYRQALERLQRSEARHRAILKAIPDRILWFSHNGVVVDAEPSEREAASEDVSDLLGKDVHQLYPPAVALRFQLALQRAVRTQQVQRLEYALGPLEQARSFEARLVPIAHDGILAIVRDVTWRRQLEQKVLRISDEERQRIGQDLHDGLGSHLTGLAMLARRLARDARRGRSVSAEALEEVAELIGQGARQARDLAHGLNPVHLQREGIAAALQELAASTEAMSDVACTFEADAGAACLALCPDAATHLYRIAQEAVANALRHADPARIRIVLQADGDALTLTVQDDGRGITPEALRHGGMGIHVMQYRAGLIGGGLDLEPALQGGTLVTCTLPHPHAAPASNPDRP